MKFFIFALVLVSSVETHARTPLRFTPVYKCVLADAPKSDELVITVNEAQDGQSQLVVKFAQDAKPSVITTKKILPPPMMAGGSIRYEGKFTDLNNKATSLSISSLPLRVEGIVGRKSSFTVDQLFDKLGMLCSFLK